MYRIERWTQTSPVRRGQRLHAAARFQPERTAVPRQARSFPPQAAAPSSLAHQTWPGCALTQHQMAPYRSSRRLKRCCAASSAYLSNSRSMPPVMRSTFVAGRGGGRQTVGAGARRRTGRAAPAAASGGRRRPRSAGIPKQLASPPFHRPNTPWRRPPDPWSAAPSAAPRPGAASACRRPRRARRPEARRRMAGGSPEALCIPAPRGSKRHTPRRRSGAVLGHTRPHLAASPPSEAPHLADLQRQRRLVQRPGARLLQERVLPEGHGRPKLGGRHVPRHAAAAQVAAGRAWVGVGAGARQSNRHTAGAVQAGTQAQPSPERGTQPRPAPSARLQVQHVVCGAAVGQGQARARDRAVVRRPPAVHAAPQVGQHHGAPRDLRSGSAGGRAGGRVGVG